MTAKIRVVLNMSRMSVTGKINKRLGTKQSRSVTFGTYPNPTTGKVFYATNTQQNYTYIVCDLVGKELERGELNNVKNNVDLSKYKAGIYFITIVSDSFRQTGRIILE